MEARLSGKARKRRYDGPLLLLSGLVIVLTFLIDLQTPLGVAVAVPYIAALFPALWLSRRRRTRMTLVIAVVASCLTVLGFWTSPPGGVRWMVVYNRGLSLLAIWLTAVAALRYASVRDHLVLLLTRQARRAREEVKALSGLLPICAHCKDIRNDSGYWQRLEAYITTHSEAQFSHGLCPKCEREHYPELLDDGRQPDPASASRCASTQRPSSSVS